MLEGAFTRELIKRLRSHAALRDAYIVKHANPFTAGVPDFSVSIGRTTLWCEVKRHHQNPTKLQWHTIKKLEDGSAVIWFNSDKLAFVYWNDITTDWMTMSELCAWIARRMAR